MKKNAIYIIILLLLIVNIELKAQRDTEFWFVVPEIFRDHNDRPIRFVFTTTDFAADITMEMPANGYFTPINLSLPANTTDNITFTTDAELDSLENRTIMDELSELLADRDNISNKGIRITSTAPITCYYEVNTTNNSDIWSLKGSNGLGKDFYIPFQDIGQNRHHDLGTRNERGWSSIEIIGAGSSTTVIQIVPGNAVFRDGANPSETDPYTITLEQGEVYTLAPAWDPTIKHGTKTGWWGVYRDQHIGGIHIHVQSGDDIAIVVKDDSVTEDLKESPGDPHVDAQTVAPAYDPAGQWNQSWGGWDIIADQWVPEHILGTEYIAMRGTLNSDEEFVFVVATEDNTRIWWTSTAPIDTSVAPNATPNEGDQVKIPFTSLPLPGEKYKYIISNKKLSVLHVSGTGTEMGGAVLPPIDKCTGSTTVGFTRSTQYVFHMNIMVRTTAKDGFLINGAAPTFFGVGDFTDIPGTPWSVAQIKNITTANIPVDVTTTISNTKDVFHLGIINETNGGAGCRFGYFSDFNEVEVSALSLQGGEQPSATPRACIGDSIQLFASGGTTYEWWPSEDLSDTTISNPKTLVTGYKVYYVKVSGFCNQSDTASVSISPLLQPEASFMLESPSGCSPLDIQIRNLSTNVSRMYWDFNGTLINGFYDQDTVIFKKVSGNDSIVVALDTTINHIFNNTSFEPIDSAQIYEVKLKVKTSKCYDSLSTYITIYPEVTADFTLSDLNDTLSCNPPVVDFAATALSINEDFYKWDFGDGALSAAGDTTHEYNNIHTDQDTTYTARLVVRSDWFCRDTAYQDFTIHPYLEGGFTIDKDQGCSPFNVQIENISSGADSIFLDYGDGEIDTLLSFSQINHLYENNDGLDEVDTNIIVMRVKNDEGCEFTDRDTIIVYPEFEAIYTIDNNSGNPYTGCNSRTVTFTNTTDDGTHLASRYLWEFADGTSMDTTKNPPINKFYNNTTADDKTYSFRLTARSIYGCTDDTTNNLTIHRAYADFTVDNNEGCSPLEVRVTNNSIGNQITNWDWDYGNGYTDTDEDPFPYTYINTSAANNTNELILKVTGTSGCTTSDTIDIVVYPQIKATYTIAETPVASCDSLTVVFTSNTIHSGLNADAFYTWDFGDGASSSDKDIITHVYKNLSSATLITRRVDLHVETPLGCYYDTSSFIDVYPLVNATIFIDQAIGCSPLTVDVNAQSYIGISTYAWDYGDAIGSQVVQDPPPYIYPANQSYVSGGDVGYELILTVKSDAAGTCIDHDTIDITVYSEIVADYTSDISSGCNPLTVFFTDQSSPNVASWQWDFGNGATSSEQNPDNEFTNTDPDTKPFNVKLGVISDRGCEDSTVAQISVLPYVIADFDINISEGCSPLSVIITNNSTAGTTGSYEWYWNDDDLVIDSTLSDLSFSKIFYHNLGGTKIYKLKLVADNGLGCRDSITRDITVHSSIVANFTFSQPDSCTTSDVAFNSNTTFPAASKYSWNFGDGSYLTTTSSTANKQFTNNTTNDYPFFVTLSVETAEGCTDVYSDNVTVYSRVIADFSIPIKADCPPFENAVIENTSTGNNSNTYEWFVDENAEYTSTGLSNFVRTYDNSNPAIRNYEIRLLATNPHGCTSEYIDTITVYEYVEASYSMNIDNGCTPLDIVFTDLSSVPASTKYTWNFGDGASSGLSDPTHKFYNSSRTTDLTRRIDLTVQSPNYCSDDTFMTVDIYHQPLANFYIDKTSSCPPLVSTLVSNSEGEDMFEWRFDDGNPNNTTDANLTYSWPNTDIDVIQTYNLELWVGTTEGCMDSTSLGLSVFPFVVADFTIDNNAGCSPLEGVNFTNTSTSPATQFFWSFGDGSTTNLENPTHDFANITSTDRVYDVFLQASSEYNCNDTITKQVTVYVQPDAEFYADPTLLTFPDNIVGIDNKTNSGPFDYYWEFGNIDLTTSVVEEPNSFEYGHWGEKIIELSVTSQTNTNCFDYYVDTITILPPLVNAAFTTNIDGGCADDGLDVEFTAQSSAYAEDYSYEWDFGDGGTGTGQYITHTFEESGAYYVKMTAKSNEGGGEDYEYKTIRVYSNPEALFEAMPTLAMLDPVNLTARVKFYNLSECNDTSGCSYVWHFGDDETAISRDVTHYYSPDPDDDFVDLGDGENGIVYDIKLVVTTAHGCKDSLTLYDEVKIIGAGTIAFPNAFNPNSAFSNNATFKPVSDGVIKYELLIYNRWGELIFTTKDLNAGWDGTINGSIAKPDVYVWKAIGTFTNGRAFELAGDVTLIR